MITKNHTFADILLLAEIVRTRIEPPVLEGGKPRYTVSFDDRYMAKTTRDNLQYLAVQEHVKECEEKVRDAQNAANEARTAENPDEEAIKAANKALAVEIDAYQAKLKTEREVKLFQQQVEFVGESFKLVDWIQTTNNDRYVELAMQYQPALEGLAEEMAKAAEKAPKMKKGEK